MRRQTSSNHEESNIDATPADTTSRAQQASQEEDWCTKENFTRENPLRLEDPERV